MTQIRKQLNIEHQTVEGIVFELSENGRLKDKKLEAIYQQMVGLKFNLGPRQKDNKMLNIRKIAVELALDESTSLREVVATLRAQLLLSPNVVTYSDEFDFEEMANVISREIKRKKPKTKERDIKRVYNRMIQMGWSVEPKLEKTDDMIRAISGELAVRLARVCCGNIIFVFTQCLHATQGS